MARWVHRIWACAGVAALLAASCGGDDSEGEEQPPDGPNCADYCDLAMENCAGGRSLYVSKDVCLSVCATFPEGKKEDTSGNTLGCRTYHAGAAAGSDDNAMTHCPHAGPGGAGYCGSNCDGYCSLVLSTCEGVYTDLDECLTFCSTFRDEEPFSANVITGDTVQCRLYHSSVATVDKIHCDHVGIDPAPETCVDTP